VNNPFLQVEWKQLCEDLRECAKAIAEGPEQRTAFLADAESFACGAPPTRYNELLKKTSAASHLAVRWQEADRDGMVDETLDESYPASDPPSFSQAHA
jgi:hypothetical protein